MKETTLYQSFLRLKKDLAPMDWSARIAHIWMYYKTTILIFAAMLAIVGYLLFRLLGGQPENLMGGIWANVALSEEGTAYVSSEYFEKLDGQPNKQTVKITPVRLDDLKNEATMEMTYYSFSKTLALLTDAEIDYLIADKTALELYISQETFLDLRELFSKEQLEALQDRLISLKTVDEEGKLVDAEYPIAIEISGLPFIQAHTTAKGPVYFGVAVNAPNKDKIMDFWEYLLAWSSEKG